MKLSHLTLFLLFFSLNANSQAHLNWIPLGNGVTNGPINPRSLYTDPVANRLYFGNDISDVVDGMDTHGASFWDGSEWNMMENGITGPGAVTDYVNYHDTLYVAGTFSEMNNIPNTDKLAVWVNNAWHPSKIKVTGVILRFEIIDDKLYALGGFDSIAGIHSRGVAVYDGRTWESLIDDQEELGSSTFATITKFQGNLYLGGNTFNEAQDLMMYDVQNRKFLKVGSGLSGAMSDLWEIKVYKDKLYVVGNMSTNQGDPGNGIAAWDGEQWHELGEGLFPGTVMSMEVYKDLLWVGGAHAGDDINDLTMGMLDIWDGENWTEVGWNCYECSAVTNIRKFRNELYIAGGLSEINGVTVNHIAKLDSNFTLGIYSEVINGKLLVSPNPSNGIFTIKLSNPISNASLQLTNSMGQIILERVILSENEIALNLLDYPIGLYHLNIIQAHQIHHETIIISR